ncbi:isoprenylcysteine carboxylmethyltransferase family protein [Rapidithrix thailandica]|uniref:Isoprenylcysteine carboxylmethyltransferase family protein n=1 Tax=Rapidithrix thailandica TaxID=413964 RepID=A0AAW9S7S6_9BACT
MIDYIILSFLCVIYFGLHSLLASHKVKSWVPLPSPYYRLAYSLIAIITLAPIALYLVSVPTIQLWSSHTLNRFFGLMLATYGIILIQRTFRYYSFKEFMGFKSELVDKHLITEGVFQYVRHPLYTATFLLSWGYVLYSPTLASLVSMIWINLYLLIGTKLEEKKLIEEFGNEYKEYQKNVPAFFPRKFPFKG